METIEIAAAGLPLHLGVEINVSSGEFISDKASAIPDEIRKIQLTPQDKVHQVSFFCYLPQERIPFFLGLNSISEKWIRNNRTKLWFQDLLRHRCPPNRVQVAVRYLLLQKSENVETSDSKFQKMFDPIIESQNKGNFLVTGIDYGHEAVVLLQHDVREQEDVQGELLLATKSFFTALAKSENTEVSCSNILSETSCRFYSDTGTPSEWMSFEDCVNRHVKPFLLLRNFKQEKPQVMQIYPVTQQFPGPTVSHFNNLEQHVSVLRDYLNNIEEQTSQIISDPSLQRVAYVKEHSNAFIKAVSHLRSLFESFQFLGESDNLLHAINVCRYYSTSAVLDEWISRKRMEIISLKRLLQGTSLTVESQENVCHKLSGKAFRVFQLKTVPSRDPIIDEIYLQMKQEVASSMFRVFEVGTASVSHLDSVIEELSSFTLKAKKSVNVVSILSTSDFFPDGSIIKFNPRATLTKFTATSSEVNQPFPISGSSLSYSENIPISSWTSNPFADAVLKRCALYKSGQPSIYNLQVVEKTPGRFHFGEENQSKDHKKILLVGPSGSGKSTLVDAMINYVLGIKWQDPFRFKLGTEEDATSRICSYTLHYCNGFRIPYSLTIIDTPGYNEHDEQNQNINCAIASFLEEGSVHAICFVVSAAECQPMQCQKSFCDWIRSTFEEPDNHVRLVTTFADGTIPPVIECCLRVGVPLVADPTSGQCYYKINNTATFADNAEESEDVSFRQAFWDMTTNTMTQFFQMVGVITKTVRIKSIVAQTEQLAATEIASNEDNFSHFLREMGTFRSMIESANLSRRDRPRRINLRNVRGALHPGITCDGCQSDVRGFRYKCIECADFDLCGRCEVLAKHSNHLMLRFSLLNELSPLGHAMAFIVTPRNTMPDQLDLENARGHVHPNVTCDGCLSGVYGFRYKCIECPDFDLCGECEALGKHPNHKMLRFSTPQSIHNVKQAIKQAITGLQQRRN